MIPDQQTIEIISLANVIEATKGQLVKSAIELGEKLLAKKESLPHGQWLPWLEKFYPGSIYEASRYIKVFKEYGNNSNLRLNANLTVSNAFLLISAPDEVKQEVQTKLDNGESVTQKEIQELKRKQKELDEAVKEEQQKRIAAEKFAQDASKKSEFAIREQENWRQQFFDERNDKRDLETELRKVKESKKETIYIDDSTKALEQYKEETEQKLFKLKQELKETQDAQHAEINKRVEQRLKNHTDVVEKLQKQETALTSSIDYLMQKEQELAQKIGLKADHLESRKQYKDHLEHMAIAANILFDESFDDEEKELWINLMENTSGLVATFTRLLKQ